MRVLTGMTLAAALIGGGFSFTTSTSMAAGGMAHAHMGHVTTGWKDTPEGKGFLPTAIAEAEIAIFHAGLALKKPGNLKWLKTHAAHIINAVDPAQMAKGPGLGYGVMKAATGTAKHIGLAAMSPDASKNVKAHSVHVATSANNTVARARMILVHGQKVMAANSAKDAAGHMENMAALSKQLLAGFDANGDGKITWQKNEGGLNAVTKHMGLMAKGEGLN